MKPDTITILGEEIKINTDYLSLTFYDEVELTEIQKLVQLKNLHHLNASSSDLLDQHLEIIGHLETLELLDLDATEITDNGLRHLESLKQLKELRLKDNSQLTDQCIDFLSNIEQLEFIHIGNTSITTNGLENLLSQKVLKFVILDSSFKKELNELLLLTEKHPTLEITLKGTGIISNGKLNG